MSWAFPNRRLLPVLAAGFAYLVLCTAQRGVLMSAVRHETEASLAEAARAMILGTQADLLVLAAITLPATLWACVLSEKAWRSTLHRRLLAGMLLVLGAAVMATMVVESLYFLAHRTRFGPGSRDRLAAMIDFAAHARGGAPAVITSVGIVALAVITVALIHPWTRRAFEGAPAARGARIRDLALHVLLLALLAVLIRTRQPEFPGRRSLEELTGNGMLRIAPVVLRHVRVRLPPRWAPPREGARRPAEGTTPPSASAPGTE